MKTTAGNSIQTLEDFGAAFRQHRLPELGTRHLIPGVLHPVLENITAESQGAIRLTQGGSSFEGRPIFFVETGSGPVRILIWTQMHGDESTATRAIGDLLANIAHTAGTASTQGLLSKLTITAVPMLNPDGAEGCLRRTAQGIDINRDALALRTPEGRLLSNLGKSVSPHFCFNLHDQELSTVGDTTEITGVALLAPAFDVTRSDNPAREHARRLGSFMAGAASAMLPGRVAKYDDGHEPRAFGDTFQKSGYPTVLLESGHIRGDSNKDEVRKVNFVLLAAALAEIARGGPDDDTTDAYDLLPSNTKRAYDVIVRNVRVGSGSSLYTTDLGVSRQVDTHPEEPPRLVDVGDLRNFVALEEMDGSKSTLQPEQLLLNNPFDFRRLIKP